MVEKGGIKNAETSDHKKSVTEDWGLVFLSCSFSLVREPSK